MKRERQWSTRPSDSLPGGRRAVVVGLIEKASSPSEGAKLARARFMIVADEQGNVISLIQSLFSAFGSGIVANDTGIVLHNRGSGFVPSPAIRTRSARASDHGMAGASDDPEGRSAVSAARSARCQ